MKYNNKWLWAVLPAALLTSCAEDVFDQYSVPEPASLTESQYLNDYKVLKDYNPGVKIGSVVNAGTYSDKGAVYGLTKTNFNEVSGEKSLMHSALIKNSGVFDIGTITDFVESADAAGHTVFGSTLLSFLNNNVDYLGTKKGILANRPDPNSTAKPTMLMWVELVENSDCEGSSVVSFYSKEDKGDPHASEFVAGKGKDGSQGIVLKATAMTEHEWDNQFFVHLSEPLPAGTKFKFSIDLRADDATGKGISTQEHGDTPGSYQHWSFVGSPQFTTDWVTYTNEGTITSANAQTIAFNLNDYNPANTYYFDNISFQAELEREIPQFYWDNLVDNSDCEGESVVSFYSKEERGDPHPSKLVAGSGKNGSKGIVLEGTEFVEHEWDNQFFVVLSEPLPAGTAFKFKMDIKASTATEKGISSQEHGATPGSYQHWAFVGSPSFTTEWQTYSFEGTTTSANAQTIAFNLNDFHPANTYYFDNISFEIEKENVVGIPLSAEEKHDTIKYALKTYIDGMMTASAGKIKAWDVLGDVLSDDGKGLREGTDDDKNYFNWAEYLNGDNGEEYALLAVELARSGFAQNGGNAADLKLFVNENGLNNAAKLDALVKKMEDWGKLDGISTSITAACSEDEATQHAEEQKIADLLSSLAKTGKLIRISGINLSYKDNAGAAVSTAKMTMEQSKKMAGFYTFIVKKYIELIPEAQRYGIFVSNIVDDGDTPNGLWNAKYSRKPQYAGFADGLQ